MIRNQAGQSISKKLINRTTGQPVTSGTVSVFVTPNGGVQVPAVGVVEHEGRGTWTYFPSQAETNHAFVVFSFSHTDAIEADVSVYPRDATLSTSSGSQPTPTGTIDKINAAMHEAVEAQTAGNYALALSRVESAWMHICGLPDSEFANERLEWRRDAIAELMRWLRQRVNESAASSVGAGSIIRPCEVTYQRG